MSHISTTSRPRTRFIARPPSGWWFSAQAVWFVFIFVFWIPTMLADPGGGSRSAMGVEGLVAGWILGSVVLATVSYAHRSLRRLP